MKNKKTSLNANNKKNKNLHKKKQKVSKSIAKKQFVSNHVANDALTNELINLQKNDKNYSTYENNKDNIQQYSTYFNQVDTPTTSEKNTKKDDFFDLGTTNYAPEKNEEDDSNIDLNESYISNMFITTLEEKNLDDNMFSSIIEEKDIEEIQLDKKNMPNLDLKEYSESIENIKHKDIESDNSTEKTEVVFQATSEEDFIQEIPNDTLTDKSLNDITTNISKEIIIKESIIEDKYIKDLPVDKKLIKDDIHKNINLSNQVEEEPDETHYDYYNYDDKNRLIPYGFFRGTLFTLLFISITLLLFTAPFIIAYIALGFLLVLSSFSVAASAFVYLENYNSGIRTLIHQIYPELHEKITKYSFLLGVGAIIIIIILYKLIYTLHSNYFSWCFRFLRNQFTGYLEYDDEIVDIVDEEESLEC